MTCSIRKRRIHGPSKEALRMAVLLAGVPLEASASLLQQLCRHGQVHLSRCQANVAKVNREVMNKTLDVRSLSIPRRQSVHCEGVSQVVQPRMKAAAPGPPQTSMFSQSPKFLSNRFMLTAAPCRSTKKRLLPSVAGCVLVRQRV